MEHKKEVCLVHGTARRFGRVLGRIMIARFG